MGSDDILIETLDIKENDRVFVFKGKLDRNTLNDKHNSYGTVLNVTQSVSEDALGSQFLDYKMLIALDNGEQVKISSASILKKYNFISCEKLNSIKLN